MTQTQSVHIDLDRVLEILRRGIRRADVFMGMGLNAAEQVPPPSHILAPEANHTIHLVKQDLTEDEQAHVAAEFGKWVRTNGLRELMESFSIFMHELYTVLFVILRSRDKLGELARIPPPRLERMGIEDQIETLSKAVVVPPGDIRIARSLNQARNCYAHRRGVVGEADIDTESGFFNLFWTAFRIEIAEPDGNVVPEAEMYGRVFENGGTVQLRVSEHSKEFRRGQELVVSKSELKEICLCVLSIGQRLFNATVSRARDEGVLTEAVSDNLNDPQAV